MNARRGIRLVDRLHFRIAFFVILTIVVIFGTFSAYQLWVYRSGLTAIEVEASEGLCQTLTSSLEIAMLNDDLPAVQYSLDEISKRDNIVRVFLLNRNNIVRASSQRELIGQTLRQQDSGCVSCHATPGPTSRSTTLWVDGERLLRVVAPVVNKPPCHSCHGDAAPYNGILILDRSLQPVRKAIVASTKVAGLVAAVSVLLMMFVFRWYIKRQVINRIVYLESQVRRVVDDQFNLEIELPGGDELTSLAHSFDNMRESLKQSIERIDSHRGYLAHLLENLTDGILILNEDDCIAFVNGTAHEILEIETSALQPGDHVGRLTRADGPFAPIVALITASGKGRRTINEVVRLRRPGHREQYLEIHTDELSLPPFSLPQRIVVIRDITARVVFERQVYQSEKLVTVGQLAAGVAHEINNPMASILTCAEGLLRNHGSEEAVRREYLDIIRTSARRCKVITQKLLDYAAAPTLSMSTVELHEVLKESMDLLQFEATRKGIRLGFEAPPHIPLVLGSKDALIQVFVNLILNGIDAAKDGGYVELDVTATPTSVDVYVHDNGSGLAEEDLPRVFDPFFTTKPVGSSSGLGLSVSQGIVKQHGGSIEFVKRDAHSTSVKVSLPICAAAAGVQP